LGCVFLALAAAYLGCGWALVSRFVVWFALVVVFLFFVWFCFGVTLVCGGLRCVAAVSARGGCFWYGVLWVGLGVFGGLVWCCVGWFVMVCWGLVSFVVLVFWAWRVVLVSLFGVVGGWFLLLVGVGSFGVGAGGLVIAGACFLWFCLGLGDCSLVVA